MSSSSLKPSASLFDAINVLEGTPKRLAVVVSDDGLVLGTLTDGDIRRHILQGGKLDDSSSLAMNTEPVVAKVGASDIELRRSLVSHNIRAMPLVDEAGKYVRTIHEIELDSTMGTVQACDLTFSAAVIMAGGEGMRLRPLTDNLPKPMLEINGVPLLERQIRGLVNIGIKLVYISINYLGEIIENYFGDGRNFGIEIRYLHETKKLGTAGALSLLPPSDGLTSVLVMNGDILTTSNFLNLLHFHNDLGSILTIGAVDYHIEIPFGVIENSGVKVTGLKEKPSQRFLCNAGIYALTTDAMGKIPNDTFYNMTDLIEKCIEDNDVVSVFPVHEYWSDIGTNVDLDRARQEFETLPANNNSN